MAQTKIKTSDYSSEESPENKNKLTTRTTTTTTSSSGSAQSQQQKQTITETRSSTSVVTKTKKVGGSSVATSTPKASNYVSSFAAQFASKGDSSSAGRSYDNLSRQEVQYQERRYKEHTQNVLNAEKELSSSKNKSLSGFLGNSFGDKSLNLDASDHIAYLEYKKAGEYWK